MIKKINFKQPKYIIPTIAYFGLLLLGYLFIDLFGTEISDDEDNGLQTTEYLNADLPSANINEEIGSKRKNVTEVFGNLVDRTAVESIEIDNDSVKKKKEFESKYSEEEGKMLDEQEKQAEEIRKLKELNEKLKASAKKGADMGSDDFVVPMTEEERANALLQRRNSLMGELDRDLNNARAMGVKEMNDVASIQDSIRQSREKVRTIEDNPKAVMEASDKAESKIVVKVSKDDNSYFNTLNENTSDNNLIKAIIDEEIKVVAGSRVRLRLLDEIKIGDVVLKKGSYIFATMNDFSQQRVTGKVQSVMVGDNILKVSLSIYDPSDGLEGLYVPASAFRETMKDIGGSALQGGGLNMGMGTGSSITQMATQAVTQAYQQTSNAISKAIKKNKVRLKYGTQIYLINSKDKK